MNKKLLLIPVIGSFALSGCSALLDTVKGLFKKDNPEEDIIADREMPLDTDIDYADLPFKKNFTDTTDNNKQYKLHEGAPANGSEYLLAFESTHNNGGDANNNKMYFWHGGPHMDANRSGEIFDYYLGCKENSAKDCARVKIEYVNPNDVDEGFYMYVVPGRGKGFTYTADNGVDAQGQPLTLTATSDGSYYDGKYIEFYNSYNTKSKYYQSSIHAVPKSELTDWGIFRFRNTVFNTDTGDDILVYSPCVWLKNPEDKFGAEFEFKGLGTYGEYISIGGICETNLISNEQYLARFWEEA